MPTAAASEWGGLLVAALTLAIVLVVCFMCVQAFKVWAPASACSHRDRLTIWAQYRPACSSQWLSDRRQCQGLTTGTMPSIEERASVSWAPCAGALGVPPPVY